MFSITSRSMGKWTCRMHTCTQTVHPVQILYFCVFNKCSFTQTHISEVPNQALLCLLKGSVVSNAGERDSEACGAPVWSGATLQFFFNVLYRLAWTMRCCVAVYGVSGCNPASHKICKNNAITMTVYKVPAVNILVKVKKKYHPMYFFFLFPVCYIFKYSRWFLRQRNLTYLKSGTSQCSIV